MRRLFLIGISVVALATTGVACNTNQPNSRISTFSPSPSPSASATANDLGYFEGKIHGWDIGPDADDQGRKLNLDCMPRQVGEGTATDLDLRLTYMPKNIGTPSHEPQVMKWVCGSMGLSVTYNFDWDNNPYEGLGILRVERLITGVRARSLYARRELVEACRVRGLPAVCVHYEDDARGRGKTSASILIIEDDILNPYARTLLITDATGIPFDELIKIAEGIR
jgi:hypothetical protein